MNKTAVKSFAVWARRKLISEITYRAGLLGVTENGAAEPLPQSTKDLQFFDVGTKKTAEVQGAEIAQRGALVAAIQSKARDMDYKAAFQSVAEEVAYFGMIEQYGAGAVAANLKAWLDETSSMGCGDDITVLIAYFMDDGAPESEATASE